MGSENKHQKLQGSTNCSLHGKILAFTMYFLSLLEIKCLYAVSIYNSEEDSEDSQHCCHDAHEVLIITEVVLDELSNLLIWLTRHLDHILHISVL